MGSSGGDTDATAKIQEAIQGVKDDVKGMEKRVAKLEAPAAKPKATPGRTVFFGEDDTDDEEEPEPPLPIPPVKAGRKADPREVEIKEPAGGKVIVYVDAEDAAVGGGGRGLAGLEKARKNAAASPMRRWENVLAKCKEITDLEGCGGVLTYFKLHTHVKHHRLALKYLHSILNIAKSTKEPAVLGHCANALVFIDQMVHNEACRKWRRRSRFSPSRRSSSFRRGPRFCRLRRSRAGSWWSRTSSRRRRARRRTSRSCRRRSRR